MEYLITQFTTESSPPTSMVLIHVFYLVFVVAVLIVLILLVFRILKFLKKATDYLDFKMKNQE